MFIMIVRYLILFICLKISIATDEVCYGSRFQPRCYSNELIVIREAYYGRKTFENCMSDEGTPIDANLQDLNFIGCYTDVKDLMRAQCAGKKECDIIIADLRKETSCYKYLKHYLFASFECMKVVAETNTCSIKTTGEHQHISNMKSSPNECGSNNKPWRIESLVGQRINVSLMQIVGKYVWLAKESCFDKVGSIVDMNNKEWINICTHEGNHVKKSFFVSDSNNIEIILEQNKKESGYLINFLATGCSDLIPPTDAWLKRTENEATIGCYSTRLRWQLKCVGQRWVGVIGNCSHGNQILISDSSPLPIENSPENSVVTIVGIAMVGFVICFLIICIGVVFLNRYYALSKSKVLKHMPLYNGDQTFRNTNGRPIDVQIKSFVDGFEGGTKIEQNFHDPKFQGEIETNQKYYELDHSLVKNEIFVN